MVSPVMQQYQKIKKEHPRELLFFRLGDFYELFYEDAKTASRVLGITLTSRFKGEKAVPMAGVPFHSVQGYLRRLLRAGYRVAICEQVEEADEAKGLVERAVTRVITPGTLTEEGLLEQSENNFLAALSPSRDRWGLAWVDLSTGDFFAEDLEEARLPDELSRLAVAECLVPESLASELSAKPARPDASPSGGPSGRASTRSGFVGPRSIHGGAKLKRWAASAAITPMADWSFEKETAQRLVREHFRIGTLAGLGFSGDELALGAAAAILQYLKDTQRGELPQISSLRKVHPGGRLWIDAETERSLELLRSSRSGDASASLRAVLDRTVTAMGARLLREWLTAPLVDLTAIRQRQDAVEFFLREPQLRHKLQTRLKKVADLERLVGRIGTGRATARDLAVLGESLRQIPEVARILSDPGFSGALPGRLQDLGDTHEICELLSGALADELPAGVREGGMFREGYSRELDELRKLAASGRDWIASFQARESERTGIASLKVGYHQVFGYTIEVTHKHLDKVPPNYVRQQTLKNAERFVTPELRRYEGQVLGAEDKGRRLEVQLFLELLEKLRQEIPSFQRTAKAIAEIEVLAGFAQVAQEGRYARPEVVEEPVLEITGGRHPVLEKLLDRKFVPNDLGLDGQTRMVVVTGPNMAGKSTYIRQAALLVILAQMGSFVPATRARIGLADRVFARVGAADELGRGQSTFMVEMSETANILRNATARSLVILDEIGRGTSTFDGLSIAWAVAEYLHDRTGCRALFATHYHELTELPRELPGARNLHVRVREWGEEIVFLYQVAEGGTDRSYGIHVARLAGIPHEVVSRAQKILLDLESSAAQPVETASSGSAPFDFASFACAQDRQGRQDKQGREVRPGGCVPRPDKVGVPREVWQLALFGEPRLSKRAEASETAEPPAQAAVRNVGSEEPLAEARKEATARGRPKALRQAQGKEALPR